MQDFIPVLDTNSLKVIHIEFPPHRKASSHPSDQSTKPPSLSDEVAEDVERIQPPRESFDFLSDLMQAKGGGFKVRDDVMPLHVVQPEGVSFKVDGNVVEWQKWKMHVG